MDWFSRLAASREGLVPLFLRLALGMVMFPRGAQKAFGWFQGPGVEKTLAAFTAMGFPQWSTARGQ